MKKMFAMMMAATMALSLTACGGSGQTETTAATTAAAAEAETKAEAAEAPEEKATEAAAEVAAAATDLGNILEGKTVGFAQTDSMSAWRTTETDDIKKVVEEAGG